uniref:Uncharacterized protein n=1 Tax=Moniliophthora roreri TaxID=221103 RepID=A0A0W0FK58_MONRR
MKVLLRECYSSVNPIFSILGLHGPHEIRTIQIGIGGSRIPL